MRVFFTNLGCKLNQAEVDDLSRRFLAAGHELAPALEEADLHVVNSCTVTHLAARDSRKVARRGHRVREAMRTVLTGCYATDSPEEAAALAGVDLVVPNMEKDRLLERVHEVFPDTVPDAVPRAISSGDSADGEELSIPYVPLDFGHARAMVKVEDGCNMKCSFCIIPSTRGRQRSRSVDEVVEEVRSLARGGYREVVITGVQISHYRDGERGLYDLTRALLEETDVPRLRLTSIAPWRFDERLLDLWSDPRLCRHIHMSLQSGSTATLRRMRRPYTADQYAALADRLRERIPGLALTTDVIVGFPGESDEEFRESRDFVDKLAFARPHLFTYSEREGTHAVTLPDPVDPRVKKERMAELQEIAETSEQAFRRSQLGETLDVVWEETKIRKRAREARLTGLTDNYVRVYAAPSAGREGEIGRVRLERLARGGVEAVPVGSREPSPGLAVLA